MDDLYRAIEANPEDPAPRLVLADLLQSEGDPRGTLVMAQHAVELDPDDVGMRATVSRLFRQHPRLVPTAAALADEPDLVDLHWRQGFVDRMSARLPRRLHYASHGPSVEQTVLELLSHPSCRFLRELVLLHEFPIPEQLGVEATARIPTLLSVQSGTRVDEDWFVQAVEENPESVRWANIRSTAALEHLASSAKQLRNLELLEISGDHRALPEGLGDLPGIRRLEVNWCRNLEGLPSGLLANPGFVYLSMYDCAGLQRAGYEMVRINQALAAWERVHASREQRQIELDLLLGNEGRAEAAASDEDLLRALDSNMAAVRQRAIRLLGARLEPLVPSGEVVLAGSFDLKKAELKGLLTGVGATVKSRIGKSTDVVLLGQNPKGLGLRARAAGLRLGLERDVLALREAPVALADSSLREALRSRDPERTAAALDALALGVLDDALVAEVLAVVHDLEMTKKVRALAKKLFSVAASEPLQRAAAAQFKQSPLTSGEEKRVQRIRAIEAAAPEFDALSFSIALCERAGCAWTLIFERAPDSEIRRLLEAITQDGTLGLGGSGLSEFPSLLAELGVRHLELNWLHLSALPPVVAEMASLESLDLSENSLAELPDLSALTVLEVLNAESNRFTELPSGLRTLPALRVLDLSAESYEGVRMRSLPDWVGELQSLRELELRSHGFASLPDGFFALSGLERLSLVGCRLPPPDARIAGWKNLRELDVAHTEWEGYLAKLGAWLPNASITG